MNSKMRAKLFATRADGINLKLYAIAHLVVDFVCISSLLGSFRLAVTENAFGYGLCFYTLIAFGTQLIFGYLADAGKWDSKRNALLGLLLCLIGILLEVSPYVSLIAIAFGNALFHVGGGADTLSRSTKLAPSGIYVSFGSIGVLLGTLFSGIDFMFYVSVGVLLLCFVMIFLFVKVNREPLAPERDICVNTLGFGGALVMLLFVIALRSFGGIVMPRGGATVDEAYFLLTAAFFGKFVGGFLADRFGAGRTALVSLLLALLVIAFFHGNVWLLYLGVALFNVTMPITLVAVYQKLPKNPGLAFGLTTLALAVGAIPTYFVTLDGKAALIVFIFVTVASIAAIAVSLNIKEE